MAYDDILNSAATTYGLNPDALKRVMMLESGGNPRSVNQYGYSGLFQLSPSEFQKWGGGNILDPNDNAMAAARKMAAERADFIQRYNRMPDAADTYLIHQQGAGGAAAHMANPNLPAWQNMLSTGEGQQKGEDWARRAIWGNIPDDQKARFGNVDNVTSQNFMDLWRDKVTGQNPPTSSEPAMAPPTAGQGGAAPSGGGLFGALGVDTSNIAGTGAGLTQAGFKIPGLGTISGSSGSSGSRSNQQQQDQNLEVPKMMPLSLAVRKPINMQGVQMVARQSKPAFLGI